MKLIAIIGIVVSMFALASLVASCDNGVRSVNPISKQDGGPLVYQYVDSTHGIVCHTTGTWGGGGGSISCVKL